MLQHIIKISATISSSISAAALVGWLFEKSELVTILPTTAAMQPNTSISLFLLGIAGLFINPENRGKAGFFSILPLLIGVATLVGYLTNSLFWIDTLFISPFFDDYTASPGRMSPLTAVCISMISLSFMYTKEQLATKFANHSIAASLAFGVFMSHIYGYTDALNWPSITGMSTNTSMTILLISVPNILLLSRDPKMPPGSYHGPLFMMVITLIISVMRAWSQYS